MATIYRHTSARTRPATDVAITAIEITSQAMHVRIVEGEHTGGQLVSHTVRVHDLPLPARAILDSLRSHAWTELENIGAIGPGSETTV
jgi:hypothetical protein